MSLKLVKTPIGQVTMIGNYDETKIIIGIVICTISEVICS